MMRFFRLLLFLVGMILFYITLLRFLQPAQPERLYLTLYGSREVEDCCFVYMVNYEKNTAERVRVHVKTEQTILAANSISSSGHWQVALVRTASTVRPYLINRIQNQDQPPIPLDPLVARSQQMLWSAQEDRLYMLVRGRRSRVGLFMLLPEQPRPVRLTPDQFGYVRSVSEQPLPTTMFTPWILMFLTCNLLLIAATLPVWRSQHVSRLPPPQNNPVNTPNR